MDDTRSKPVLCTSRSDPQNHKVLGHSLRPFLVLMGLTGAATYHPAAPVPSFARFLQRVSWFWTVLVGTAAFSATLVALADNIFVIKDMASIIKSFDYIFYQIAFYNTPLWMACFTTRTTLRVVEKLENFGFLLDKRRKVRILSLTVFLLAVYGLNIFERYDTMIGKARRLQKMTFFVLVKRYLGFTPCQILAWIFSTAAKLHEWSMYIWEFYLIIVAFYFSNCFVEINKRIQRASNAIQPAVRHDTLAQICNIHADLTHLLHELDKLVSFFTLFLYVDDTFYILERLFDIKHSEEPPGVTIGLQAFFLLIRTWIFVRMSDAGKEAGVLLQNELTKENDGSHSVALYMQVQRIGLSPLAFSLGQTIYVSRTFVINFVGILSAYGLLILQGSDNDHPPCSLAILANVSRV